MAQDSQGIGTSFGLLILRLMAGGLLLYGHGWAKLMNFAERSRTFPDPIGLGSTVSLGLVVFAEVFCSALVMLGFVTRFAAVPPVIFFLIAAFVQHLHDPWAKRELPLIYLAAFLALVFTGAGRFSIDARFAPRLSFRGEK